MTDIKNLIHQKDYKGLRKALADNPFIANMGISFDAQNPTKEHPLHRICDGVFAGLYSDEEAKEMAELFLEYGANVNGFGFEEKKDTPLIAAASLSADKTGILYIEKGANIHHAGCHGGTALHWAAWCGRDLLVKRLIAENAELNKLSVDFKSTPLLWAVHGYVSGGRERVDHYAECIRLLIDAGANKTIPNLEGKKPIEFLDHEDEIAKLLY
jgi:ankyrin repeat protein